MSTLQDKIANRTGSYRCIVLVVRRGGVDLKIVAKWVSLIVKRLPDYVKVVPIQIISVQDEYPSFCY